MSYKKIKKEQVEQLPKITKQDIIDGDISLKSAEGRAIRDAIIAISGSTSTNCKNLAINATIEPRMTINTDTYRIKGDYSKDGYYMYVIEIEGGDTLSYSRQRYSSSDKSRFTVAFTKEYPTHDMQVYNMHQAERTDYSLEDIKAPMDCRYTILYFSINRSLEDALTDEIQIEKSNTVTEYTDCSGQNEDSGPGNGSVGTLQEVTEKGHKTTEHTIFQGGAVLGQVDHYHEIAEFDSNIYAIARTSINDSLTSFYFKAFGYTNRENSVPYECAVEGYWNINDGFSNVHGMSSNDFADKVGVFISEGKLHIWVKPYSNNKTRLACVLMSYNKDNEDKRYIVEDFYGANELPSNMGHNEEVDAKIISYGGSYGGYIKWLSEGKYDLNEINENSLLYTQKGATNTPPENNYLVLSGFHDDKEHGAMLALNVNDDQVYYRRKLNNTWKEWRKIAFEEEKIKFPMFTGSEAETKTIFIDVADKDYIINRVRLTSGDKPTGRSLKANLRISGGNKGNFEIPENENLSTWKSINSNWNEGQKLEVQITQIGSSNAGSNLTLNIEYQKQ